MNTLNEFYKYVEKKDRRKEKDGCRQNLNSVIS
jgi:hypothetical protein